MKKALIITNNTLYTYKLRKELITALIRSNFEVHICVPKDENSYLLEEMGCILHDVTFNGRGKNIIDEFKLIAQYRGIIKKLSPSIMLTFTIKPNIYGSILSKQFRIPVFANVTGLGSAFNSSIIRPFVIALYRFSFSKVRTIFFQNNSNLELFKNLKISKGNGILIPGSGVNTDEMALLPFPLSKNPIVLAYVGRLMKEKGIYELIDAAKNYCESEVKFVIAGSLGTNDVQMVEQINQVSNIEYIGQIENIQSILNESHALIHPSYHEGMSNAMLEASSSGRPVLASMIPGCQEIFDSNDTGLGFYPQNSASMISAIDKFAELSITDMREMGLRGREKMKNEFDRKIIVKRYLEEIEKLFIEDENEK